MYERFTDRARKVMQLANTAAVKNGAVWIDAIHVAMGLLAEGSGVGANVIKEFGVTEVELRQFLPNQSAEIVLASTGRLPNAENTRKVIEEAINFARDLQNGYIGTEHLAVGVDRVGVFAKLGIHLGAVEKKVRKLLNPEDDEKTGDSTVYAIEWVLENSQTTARLLTGHLVQFTSGGQWVVIEHGNLPRLERFQDGKWYRNPIHAAGKASNQLIADMQKQIQSVNMAVGVGATGNQ